VALSDVIANNVTSLIRTSWTVRDGRVVPEADDITLKSNGAVKLQATYLYADIADSSRAAQVLNPEVAGSAFKAFLSAASTLIRHYDGQIRSFDGDRVMAIYIGDQKNTLAVRTALAINWAVSKVVRPALLDHWSNFEQYWTLKHAVGIDTGEALLIKGGIPNFNDLVSVGSAPNVAAKLSSIRSSTGSSYITKPVLDDMDEAVRLHGGLSMWSAAGSQRIGGQMFGVYSSNYHWEP
jgi:adenylate cyclase